MLNVSFAKYTMSTLLFQSPNSQLFSYLPAVVALLLSILKRNDRILDKNYMIVGINVNTLSATKVAKICLRYRFSNDLSF